MQPPDRAVVNTYEVDDSLRSGVTVNFPNIEAAPYI
jgi:hypothetical protein